MKLTYFTGAIAAALIGAAGSVSAAIVTDGNVSLGVDTYGQLNVGGGTADVVGQTIVGVRWIDPSGTQYESTSHGCLCEGWGLSVDGTNAYSNNAYGTTNMTVESPMVSSATAATTVTRITGTDVTVTHDFALSSATDDLFEVTVTVTNTGAGTASGLTYRRAMDWDTSPTPFNEYVTIGGTATTTLLSYSSDDGFASSMTDPASDLASCGTTVDFTACGPSDHGSVFDFALADLGAGESYTFTIFYGGAANKAAADAALGAVGAELYSYGWSGTDKDQDGFNDSTGAATPTFIFAFKGVGGTVVIPPNPSAVPLPAAGWLMIAGLGGLAAMGRKRKAA